MKPRYDGRLKKEMMEEKKLQSIAKMQQKELMQRVNEIKVLRSKTSRVRILFIIFYFIII